MSPEVQVGVRVTLSPAEQVTRGLSEGRLVSGGDAVTYGE